MYKHYGRDVVAAIMADHGADAAELETVYLEVYKKFVEAVDAIDNGVNQYDTDAAPRYEDKTGLAARVGGLNPAWNQGWGPAALDAAFEKAATLTGAEFVDRVTYIVQSWLPARALVVAALDGAAAVDGGGEIVRLATACPWKEHLFALEAERSTPGRIKFVLYPDDASGGFRVQAVPRSPVRGAGSRRVEAAEARRRRPRRPHPPHSARQTSFTNRVSLPEPLQGLRDGELDARAAPLGAPPGGVFIHASGFIGGHATVEGAKAYAVAALAARAAA